MAALGSDSDLDEVGHDGVVGLHDRGLDDLQPRAEADVDAPGIAGLGEELLRADEVLPVGLA